jgi:rfaE bifunctional protein kinase chain/domain
MANEEATSWLDDVLRRIPAGRVTVFGDFCLDAYWHIDDGASERSVETGRPVRRVRRQRYTLGGAGNVAANLTALGVGQVQAVGLIGDDLFGHQILELLEDLGVKTEGVLPCQADWQTFVYAKPYLGDEEQNRIDFGAFNRVTPESIERIAEELARAAEASDAVILNQQIPVGLSAAPMIERINRIIAECPDCLFIVDSRHRGELYRGAALKVNTREAARLCGRAYPLDYELSDEDGRALAAQLHHRSGKPVFVTRGVNGIVVAHEGGVDAVPGIRVGEPIDPVGAGDTVVAALAAALAVGADVLKAAKLANIAASVTVRKLGITGTASPAEIRAIGRVPDHPGPAEQANGHGRAGHP